jgi:hypothetical protein
MVSILINSLSNKSKTLETEAPTTFLMPISLVRRRVVKEAIAYNPNDANIIESMEKYTINLEKFLNLIKSWSKISFKSLNSQWHLPGTCFAVLQIV